MTPVRVWLKRRTTTAVILVNKDIYQDTAVVTKGGEIQLTLGKGAPWTVVGVDETSWRAGIERSR